MKRTRKGSTKNWYWGDPARVIVGQNPVTADEDQAALDAECFIMQPESDPLGPARGCFNATAISLIGMALTGAASMVVYLLF